MEYPFTDYINIGIWVSGIIFTLLLTTLLTRIFYRSVIRPWRRIAPLTVADLKNRRKHKNLKETYLMKLIKAAIWVSGIIFAILMAWGIALSIRYDFQGEPIKKHFIPMLSNENADQAARLADIKQTIARIGSTKNEALWKVKAEIARIEREYGGAPVANAALMTDYKSLCLLRDILESTETGTTHQGARDDAAFDSGMADEDRKTEKKKTKRKKNNDSSTSPANH